MTPGADRIVLVRTVDALVARRAERVAAAAGLGIEALAELAPPPPGEPVGLLVELELEGAVDLVARSRAEHPEMTIVGFVSSPTPDLWTAAEEAGADVVTTRGRADRELARVLDDRLSGRRRARRLRLAPLRDFAGRLGYVGRIDDTPVGPIALFHLGGRLYAVSDVCPHAGSSLCAGELDGDVITCPRHGSQFRVTDGARVRGPADAEVAVFPVVVESGEAFVELPG